MNKLEEFKEWLTIHPNCSKELNWTIAFQDRNFQRLLTEGHWTFLYNRLRSLYLSQWEKYMAVLEQWREQEQTSEESDFEEEETKDLPISQPTNSAFKVLRQFKAFPNWRTT